MENKIVKSITKKLNEVQKLINEDMFHHDNNKYLQLYRILSRLERMKNDINYCYDKSSVKSEDVPCYGNDELDIENMPEPAMLKPTWLTSYNKYQHTITKPIQCVEYLKKYQTDIEQIIVMYLNHSIKFKS